MFLLQLPIWIALVIVALGGAAAAVGFSAVLRSLWRPEVTDELRELGSQSARRLGAVYALILALAFNTVMAEHSELEEAIDEEAVLLTQILEDAVEETDPAVGREIVRDLAIYVDEVIEREWHAETAVGVGRKADAALERVRNRLQGLEAEQPQMVAETDNLIDEVERRRLQRLLDLEQTLPPIFWILSLVLFFATLVPTVFTAPSRHKTLMMGTYGAAIGLVLYNIWILSEPFRSSMQVSNESFRLVQYYLEQAARAADGSR